MPTELNLEGRRMLNSWKQDLTHAAGEARVATAGHDGPPETAPRVRITSADGDYFHTMGISLLA